MRFISLDTHWNQNNSIYGDKEGEVKIPDIKAIMQSSNLYVYCVNNPLIYFDPSGYIAEPINGYEFMNRIYKQFPGLLKNTKTFVTDYGKRIPDIINRVVIGEIKNVKYQYLSSQIKGFLQIASDQGKKFILIIKEGTRVSKPLIDAIKNSGGKIIEVGDKSCKTLSGPFIINIEFIEKCMDSFNSRYFKEVVY